jgi:hypothetical protein
MCGAQNKERQEKMKITDGVFARGREPDVSHRHLDEESTRRSPVGGGSKKIADNPMDQDVETRLRNLRSAPRCGH